MRCRNCGAELPEGQLICPVCHAKVQIVPDYNPLEDVLAREVKGSVEYATRPIDSGDVRRYRSREERENDYATRVLNQGEYRSSTRVLSQGEMGRIRSQYTRTPSYPRYGSRSADGSGASYRGNGYVREDQNRAGQDSGRIQRNLGNVRQETDSRRLRNEDSRQNAQERRRQQKSRKRRSAKKRMQKFVTIFCMILAIGGILGYLLYQNSYAGTVGKGQKALQSGDYSTAESYFERAVQKDAKKADAYSGLSKVYIQQKNLDKAEEVFITVIDSQPENADLYEAAIRFYMDTEQQEKISPLLDGCDEAVLSRVPDYVSEMPTFSIDEGTYQEVQEIALSGEGEIHYTDDGSTPTASSTLYKEPILLDVGTTVINAICVNKKGIPSLTASRSYTIELPIADAPAVTPSTGQYNAPFQITIQVPEGYTAYYTTDDSTPSAASEQYTGPIDMPQGHLIFSAVLVSDSGKMTGITKRNYVLQME